MAELHFCPNCDAPQHKMLQFRENVFYCKSCSVFFSFSVEEAKCERCDGKLVKSDFDSPSGGVIFYCQKCKKTYPVSELAKQFN